MPARSINGLPGLALRLIAHKKTGDIRNIIDLSHSFEGDQGE
jgi:hypothetical protein